MTQEQIKAIVNKALLAKVKEHLAALGITGIDAEGILYQIAYEKLQQFSDTADRKFAEMQIEIYRNNYLRIIDKVKK